MPRGTVFPPERIDRRDATTGLLVRQVTSPVRWTETTRWFIGQGVRQYYEVGPGRVIQGLLRRTDSSLSCLGVMTAEDVGKYAQPDGDDDPS